MCVRKETAGSPPQTAHTFWGSGGREKETRGPVWRARGGKGNAKGLVRRRRAFLAKRGRCVVSDCFRRPAHFNFPAPRKRARQTTKPGRSRVRGRAKPLGPGRQGCSSLLRCAGATLVLLPRRSSRTAAAAAACAAADRGKRCGRPTHWHAPCCSAAVFPDLLPRCSGRAKDALAVDPERGVLAPLLTSGAYGWPCTRRRTKRSARDSGGARDVNAVAVFIRTLVDLRLLSTERPGNALIDASLNSARIKHSSR